MARVAGLETLRPKVAGHPTICVPSPTARMLDLHNWRDRVWKPAVAAAEVEAVAYEAGIAGSNSAPTPRRAENRSGNGW